MTLREVSEYYTPEGGQLLCTATVTSPQRRGHCGNGEKIVFLSVRTEEENC